MPPDLAQRVALIAAARRADTSRFRVFSGIFDDPSVPGTRDRGASQYLKTADSLAAKHLIGPAQSDLCGFFVVRGTRWGKTADGIAGGDLLARRENFGAVAIPHSALVLPSGLGSEPSRLAPC